MSLTKAIIFVLLIMSFIIGSIFLATFPFSFLHRELSIQNNSKKINFYWNYNNNKKLISCLKEISTQKQQHLNKIMLIIEDSNLQTPLSKPIYEEKKQLLKVFLYLPSSPMIKNNNLAYTRVVYTNLIFSLMEYYKMQDQQNCLYEEYLETRDNKIRYFNISLK
ncbi:MAG: hypothetical protein KatS3mg089_0807 [Patescibacteria group bacterium]|nr:MAG: hypothetical protein KatS3mg089_0807 [Patescibacteria group bacterium]